MGKFSRSKGARRERELVKLYAELGAHALRVPLSGAAEGFKGDVLLSLLGGLRSELKARGNGEGFKTIQTWLGDNDLLHLWVDRAKPLTVLPWSTWSAIVMCLLEYQRHLEELEAVTIPDDGEAAE